MKIKTVVIAEDDADLRKLLVRVVRRTGCRVIEAANGRAALAMARGADAAVLDIGLPGMSGLQVCQTLRAEEGADRLPIVMFSAAIGDDPREAALTAGADVYLAKPFPMAELTNLINAVLGADPVPTVSPSLAADLAGVAAMGYHQALEAIPQAATA